MIAGRVQAAFQRPLLRRLTRYSAGSLVAAVSGELAFVLTFAWGHAGTTWAAAAGFVGGAAPNYILNRRWAWPDRRGRSRRAEATWYVIVALSSFGAAAVATHWAEEEAERLFPAPGWQTVVVAAAYLAVSGLFFLIKFALYERVVFVASAPEPPSVQTTRS
jgi:putative flippase GtrA